MAEKRRGELKERSEFEGLERDTLGSDEEFAGEGGFGETAAQGFFGANAGEIGIVVFLRDVRKDEIPGAGIEAFGIGKKFADGEIRKMSGAGEDALLDDPRVGADFQHVEIVIGFEDEAIGLAEMNLDEFGHVAEIGADGHLGAVRPKSEADGIGGVVRDGESVDVNVADGKALASLDGFDAAEALSESVGEDALEGVHGGFGDVQRRFPDAEDLREAVAVVGVFVGDEDGVEMVDVAFDSGEAGEGFAFAETGVNEDAGGVAFQQGDVARTAGGKDGNAKADWKTPEKRHKLKPVLLAPR
jgi:hypothetical protein